MTAWRRYKRECPSINFVWRTDDMDPIYEISAAPHLPAPLKTLVPQINRPESLAGWLNLVLEYGVEVEMRNGEIYILPASA